MVGAVAKKLGDDTALFVAERLTELSELDPAQAIRGAIAIVIDAYHINPVLRRLIRDHVPEVVPHFATPEVDDQLRTATNAHASIFS